MDLEIPAELKLKLGQDQQQLLTRFLTKNDNEALKALMLSKQVDEITKCLVVKYILMETSMTKYDIAKVMGWGRSVKYVNRILKRCNDGDGNNSGNDMVFALQITSERVDEIVRRCIEGDCGEFRNIINITKLKEYEDPKHAPPLLLIVRAGVVNIMHGHGISWAKIRQIIPGNNDIRLYIRLNEIFEFNLVSEFKPKNIFDAYWQFTSELLNLPFIMRPRFDPPDDGLCYVFNNNKRLCYYFALGVLLAEIEKSEKNYYGFKKLSTTKPASIPLMLGVLQYLVKEYGIKVKIYIYTHNGQIIFILDSLLEDIKRDLKVLLTNPATTIVMIIEENGIETFLAFLAGLLAGDGSISWDRMETVMFSGNRESERKLYITIQSELSKRFGIRSSLVEYETKNAVELFLRNDNAIALLQLFSQHHISLIEPLKELRRQLLLMRDSLNSFLVGKLFKLFGDNGFNSLESYRAAKFFTFLADQKFVKLRPTRFKYYILEFPNASTNPLVRGY